MKIRKAVIPVAGLGTRFLPATKAQPKEMLPIVDKPAVQYIVEEAVQSGIESILFVTGRNKKAIEDHFDKSVELEQQLLKKEKFRELDEVRAISNMANIHFIRQKEPLGLGHAVLCAQEFVGDEPFAVLLGDDIMMSKTPALQELIQWHRQTEASVIGVQPVEREVLHKYGVIHPDKGRGPVRKVIDLIEKPAEHEAPSNLAVMGRYILNPSIFPVLETLERGAGNEIQLTDALRKLCSTEALHAIELQGKRFDIGDHVGYMKAMIEMGLQREPIRSELYPFLENIMRSATERKGSAV
ncbi:UTP--glucose-1-phosphate uridylyltransferase GalU [Fictibacillus enclensis]|uniref:UTP--glucose-1-phosphate uridylyltransferase GalU n=1 Tax=Fictibacillus enclensis TaxID=1017270 RepID=UPI0024BF9440|nr:UTP--glucose-1-phosphate uridylyltransferase GalU [Fictibacillus enclensis]WHY73666.1 UTP--glucose-1-phosphate uridylyltransferase GalU [Fictibacillus enclensis]